MIVGLASPPSVHRSFVSEEVLGSDFNQEFGYFFDEFRDVNAVLPGECWQFTLK
jgi:hypothetical protein